MTKNSPKPQIAVSIALRHSEDGSFLLVRRARAPSKDMWAFAGGRVEFGETMAQAAAREIKEETGLVAEDVAFLEPVEIIAGASAPGEAEHHYVLCVHTGSANGFPVAGDDAAEARWVPLDDFSKLNVTASTYAIAKRIVGKTGIR